MCPEGFLAHFFLLSTESNDMLQTYVFLPEDEEECKFQCLGEWDGHTIAAMIEDFHIMKFLRNDPKGLFSNLHR